MGHITAAGVSLAAGGQSLRGIHMERLLCVNAHVLHCFGQSSTWILKLGLRGEKKNIQKRCTLVDSESVSFVYR